MNILVIGNGFDLAHGLPTKYSHFLEFCKRIFPIYQSVEGRGAELYQQEHLAGWEFNKEIKEALLNAYKSRKKVLGKRNQSYFQTNHPKLDEMYALIRDNIWIEYFMQCNMFQKENWIDFEREISNIIQSLESDMHGLHGNGNINDDVILLSNHFLNEKYSKYTFTAQSIDMMSGKEISDCIQFREIRDDLLKDLNKLIRALEIYLCEYVEKMEIKKKSLDVEGLNIAFILSFNYTHIFSKLYDLLSDSNKQEDYNPFDYIHGEADINNLVESNNMVLGIDEYLPDDRKNTDTEFIAFKKYYQRIFKQTGCKYKKWVESINNRLQEIDDRLKNQYSTQIPYNKIANKYRNQLYIFGHSLDVTDKDILRDLILNDNVYTTIFYVNKDVMGQQIANLVKVIGQDELIRRTGGSTKTIEFKLQQDMVPINE